MSPDRSWVGGKPGIESGPHLGLLKCSVLRLNPFVFLVHLVVAGVRIVLNIPSQCDGYFIGSILNCVCVVFLMVLWFAEKTEHLALHPSHEMPKGDGDVALRLVL